MTPSWRRAAILFPACVAVAETRRRPIVGKVSVAAVRQLRMMADVLRVPRADVVHEGVPEHHVAARVCERRMAEAAAMRGRKSAVTEIGASAMESAAVKSPKATAAKTSARSGYRAQIGCGQERHRNCAERAGSNGFGVHRSASLQTERPSVQVRIDTSS